MDIQKRQRISGFSLFEMTIVLVIISVVLTGLLPFITESMQSDYANTTVERMEAIDKALRDYALSNKRLPCPADATDLVDDGEFGREDGTNGNCIDGDGLSGPGTSGFEGIIYDPAESTDVVGGMIPTKEIFLPDEFAFDGWGRRFMYHVSIPLTAVDGLIDNSEGNIIVDDAVIESGAWPPPADEVRTLFAAYVLMSTGPNGHGGFLLSGAKYDAASMNGHEALNCGCPPGSADFDFKMPRFFQHMEQYETGHADERDYYFDDLVRFRMVSHLD